MKKALQRKSPKKNKPTSRGNREAPYLAVATTCERVLMEKADSAGNEIVSLVRLIDTFNITGDEREMPPGVIAIQIYLQFRAGEAVGDRSVEIAILSPSEEVEKRMTNTLHFEGGAQGASIIFNVKMTVKETGVYWFHVTMNGRDVTRIPLTINYRRIQKE